jgi:VCBS repeat-containing protein
MAAPTAVNDAYSTPEDVVLNVSAAGGGSFLSDVFAANLSGWTYANNIWGNANSNGNSTGAWTGAAGNPAGSLTMNRSYSFNTGTQRSGGFSKSFTLAAAQTVRVSFDTRVVPNAAVSAGATAVVQSRVGTTGTPVQLYTHIGNATSAWQPVTYTVSLPAGTHTLQIGLLIFGNSGSSTGANFDNITVESDGGGGILANDTGGVAPVTATKLTEPANGAAILNADGSFTYTPNANFSGTDSFTYRASDGTGDSAPATVTINVTPVNDAPVALADAYSTNEDTPLNTGAPGLLSNDTDADGNPLTAAIRSQPGNGAAVLNANGSFTYTPNANFSGTDTFSYRVNDGTTNSNDATVTITVNAVNDPPTGVPDGYFTTVNTPLNVTLTTPEGQPTTTVTLVAPGSTVPAGDPAEADLPVWRFLDNGTDQGTAWRNPGFDDSAWDTGKAELGYGDDADGRPERTVVLFGPDGNNKYATTYFRTTFQVVDRNSLSSLAMLLMRDDAAAVYLNGSEIYRDQTANGFPGLNANPAFNAYSSGSISNADEAALRDLTSFMTANAAQFLVEGTNVLAVEVHQANGTSSDLSMDIQLTAQRGPYAGVLFNDSDAEGSALTAALVTAPAGGSLTLNANGTFSYTPAPGFTGTASFVYRANDGALNSANTTVTITVASAGNAPPVAGNDAYSTSEDVPLNIAAPGLLANDTDPENGALTAQQLTGPANGTLTLSSDGSFLYTPAANFNGSDSFTYRARDPLNANSAAATVSLTVNPVNDAPVAVADTYGTDVGVTLVVPAVSGLLANDTDAEGSPLTALLVSGPASGSLVLSPNGSFTYTPPAGFAGQRTFTYRTSDGAANSNTVTVTINILGAPTANANSYTTAEDTPLTISAPGVLANDTDPQSLPLTAVNATQPANGSVVLNPNGSFTFTPPSNFAGSTSFTYQASNGSRTSAPATVSLTVTAVNDAPVAANDSYNGMPGETLLIATAQGVLANDSDAESSPLTLTQLSDPLNGVLSLAPDGSFSYVPNTGFTGSDSFTYKVSDGALESAAATVTLTIAQPGGDIVINEIMYRPGAAYPENTALEWIELHNRGTTSVDLTGWTISSGVTYAFPSGRIMSPGSYLVVAANVAAFQAAYPGVTNVIGSWTGALSSGEKIQLTDAQLTDYDKVSYADEGDWATRDFTTTAGWFWTTLSNGGNRTLALRNPALSNDNGQAWAVSQTSGGTPGSANDVLTANIPPIIKAVKHVPAVPASTDRVRISCELNDESSFSALTATLFWRVSVASPGAFQQLPMSQDGKGEWFAKLEPQANNTIIEFYISASDGVNTRTWPAVTTQGQTANCLYQVSNEAVSATAETVRLVLTSADNTTFTGLSRSGERQFNHTLVVVRGQETSVRYRSSMRMRGNSSKSYALHAPLRITMPDDDDLGGETGFNLHPKAPHIQHLGMRIMLASGIQASHTHPVEFRRNGVEYTTSSGSTPDFGMWARVEGENGNFIANHWPNADTGGFYTKRSPERYWRSSGWTVPSNPTGLLDDWTKQNNANANDWTELTDFFSITQSTAAAHFPGASATDVSQSNGGRLSGTGAWDFTAMTGAEFTQLNTVADTDQWARFFAAMTILMDYETNVSNGVDDDYGIYFLPSAGGQRRAQFVPHDLDTIFGLGDTQPAFNAVGLYDMTEGGGSNYAFRTLLPLVGTTASPGHAGWRTTYHNALRELLGTVFNTDNGAFQQSVDYHLSGWVPAATRDSIKTFAANRRAYLLGLLGGSATAPPPGTSNATVTSAHGTLFISEILANNAAAHNNSATFPDVIELHNTGAAAVNLTGYSLTDDPLLKTKYVFPSGSTIAAGARLVVYADSAATPGTHTGFGLDNDGGVVQLYTPVTAGQAIVDGIAYGLQAPDLSIGRTGAALDVWTLCTPTIGVANTAVAALADPAGLRINEFLGNADYRAANDFIELYNPAATPVALGGMRLTDDFVNYPQRHLIPSLSFMAAGQFVAFEAKGSAATAGNARELPFNIGSSTGGVALLGANGSPVDKGDTLPQFRDVSIGRSPDGTGAFIALSPPSPGASNAPLPDTALELLAFLRITEMMYNPASSAQSEYIEFRNLSDTITLDLSGVSFKNGITFTFPPGSTLAPGAFLVIVENSARFTTQFPAVPVGGVYTGRLDNGGERVRFDIPGYNIAILDFTYDDAWYPSTDGGGDAMQIVSAAASPAMWDRSEGWQASTPNPGSVPPFGVYAGVDLTVPVGVPVFLDGALNNGTFTASSISVLWTRDSGPASATFTTAACDDANAIFTTPGVYVLRLTATAPGPVTATDLVTVTVYQTYATWAATALAGQSAANQLPGADPDGDGVSNAAEWALNGSPLNATVTGQPVPASHDGLLAFTWTRNLLADPAVQTIPQLSGDLVQWQEGPAVLDTVSTGSTASTRTWLSTETGFPGFRARAYMRVLVIVP